MPSAVGLDGRDELVDAGGELGDLVLLAEDLAQLRGALEARARVELAGVGTGEVDRRRDLGQLVVLAGAARGGHDELGLELGDGLEVGLEERADLRQIGVLREVVGQHGIGDADHRVAGADGVERVEGGDVEGDDRGGVRLDLDGLAVDLGVLLVRRLAVPLDEHQGGLGVLDDDGRRLGGRGGLFGRGRRRAGGEGESGDAQSSGGQKQARSLVHVGKAILSTGVARF